MAMFTVWVSDRIRFGVGVMVNTPHNPTLVLRPNNHYYILIHKVWSSVFP